MDILDLNIRITAAARFDTDASVGGKPLKVALQQQSGQDPRRFSRLSLLAALGANLLKPIRPVAPDCAVYTAAPFSSPSVFEKMTDNVLNHAAAMPFDFIANLHNAPSFHAAQMLGSSGATVFVPADNRPNRQFYPLLAAALSLHAAAWGILLLGSILCYGIAPRLIAWIICWQQSRRHPLALNLALPYYQNIIQKWQQQIIDDSSDYQPDRPTIAPTKIPLNHTGAHWAILLEAPDAPDNWYSHILGQDWTNKGSIVERAQLTDLITELAAQPVQLLIGIRAQQTPDRGIVRQISKLAQATQHNIIIQLLPSNPSSQTPAEQERRAQWQQVLHEHGWNGLN